MEIFENMIRVNLLRKLYQKLILFKLLLNLFKTVNFIEGDNWKAVKFIVSIEAKVLLSLILYDLRVLHERGVRVRRISHSYVGIC